MAKQVPWSKVILEEFIREACLTEDEEAIMRTRVKGWSITKQAYEFNMSISKVNQIIKRLKLKYDNVQKYDVLLPPRKSSAKEIWMDSN